MPPTWSDRTCSAWTTRDSSTPRRSPRHNHTPPTMLATSTSMNAISSEIAHHHKTEPRSGDFKRGSVIRSRSVMPQKPPETCVHATNLNHQRTLLGFFTCGLTCSVTRAPAGEARAAVCTRHDRGVRRVHAVVRTHASDFLTRGRDARSCHANPTVRWPSASPRQRGRARDNDTRTHALPTGRPRQARGERTAPAPRTKSWLTCAALRWSGEHHDHSQDGTRL